MDYRPLFRFIQKTLLLYAIAILIFLPVNLYAGQLTIFYKGIMPSEKVLDFPVDCNTLTGSVNL